MRREELFREYGIKVWGHPSVNVTDEKVVASASKRDAKVVKDVQGNVLQVGILDVNPCGFHQHTVPIPPGVNAVFIGYHRNDAAFRADISSNLDIANTFFPNQHISVVDKTEETEDIASSDVTEAAILEKRQDLISQRAVRR